MSAALDACNTAAATKQDAAVPGVDVAASDHDGAASGRDGPTGDARLVPDGIDWQVLPGATIKAACPFNDDPVIRGAEGCSGIINDWAGGMADLKRNRLIVWGGGHNGYYGNELYALELDSQRLVRLNDPSPPHPVCVGELADGTPASRHTYDGLAYIAHADRLFAFGGAEACPGGGFVSDTWTLDMASLKWTRADPTKGGPPAPNGGAVADYDPQTKLVFLHDTHALWTYNLETNSYVALATGDIDYHLTGRIDPVRRLFILVGNGSVHVYDISAGANHKRQDWKVTGCDTVVRAIYPGLAYHATSGRFVAWAGGNSVYVFNPDSRSCEKVTGVAGPGPQVGNGTNGRFRYFPALDVFAVVNQWNQDAYLLRLK